MNSFCHEHVRLMIKPSIVSQYIYKDNDVDHLSNWNVHSPGENKNHETNTNPTVLPDNFLLSERNRIYFTIRHPSKIVSSMHRIAKVTMPDSMTRQYFIHCSTSHWTRLLYDWLLSHGIEAPIIDADDLLTRTSPPKPSPNLRKLCTMIGLDPDAILTSWPKATDQEKAAMNPLLVLSMMDILDSEGLIEKRGKMGRDMTIEEERPKWVKEFGEDGAKFVQEIVEMNMEDYNYLWQRRVVA